MAAKVVRKVVLDVPTNTDLFRGMGHDRTAKSLAQAIKSFNDDDRAIGLDGPWGSGKSSVVEIAARHLAAEKKKNVEYLFFTFDIWKSQGTGFRRSFLEHFVNWAKHKFPKSKTILEKIEEDIRGKKREISTNNQPILGWFGIVVLFLLPLLPIYYFWAKAVFDELAKGEEGQASNFITSPPAYVFYLFAFLAVCTAVKKMSDNDKKISFKEALSSVLLISSKQHQDHKAIQKIREIDPSDYEFHTTLRRILAAVQSNNKRVVVVLDNIDRLPKDEIRDYWAVVRSIFSGSLHLGKTAPNETITAIVPYDRSHIEGSINEDNKLENSRNNQLTRLSARELFSKTFDEILTVAPPVLSNARDFFAEKLEEALPKQVKKDHSFRTYRIFAELLRVEGGLTTPRQVVSFVNDVSGLYALHEGQFSLPTIAAYIAHQDLLSQDPSTLNDVTSLNPKIVDLASDPDLAQNLAAIIFNVAPELAFEVLLDNELSRAMTAADHEELERLSRSSGFDLRVDDVLQSNSEEWVTTGDYGVVIANFAKIMSNYPGAAKPRIIEALIKGFLKIESLAIEREEYEPFLLLFDIVGEEDRISLVKEFLRRGFQGANKQEGEDFEIGRSFAEFLGETREKFVELELEDSFKDELRKLSPKSTADFLYGLALDVEDFNINFSDLGQVAITLPSEGNYYESISIEDPAAAFIALKQFSKKSLLKKDDWVAVAQACIKECCDGEQSPQAVASHLNLTSFARSQLSKESRSEVTPTNAITEGQFFRNLGNGETVESEEAIALTIFLLGEVSLGETISPPTKTHPNGQRVQDVSEEFTKLNSILTGTTELSNFQAEIISNQAKSNNSMVGNWTKFGKEHSDHLAAQSVVKFAYLNDPLPNITLFGLCLHFDYLSNLLGTEAFVSLLDRFEPELTDTYISEAKLDHISPGFLSCVSRTQGGRWHKYLKKVETLLQSISSTQWLEELESFGLIAKILLEKSSTSGCSLSGSSFRDPIAQKMLDVLAGRSTPPAPDKAFDTMMNALDSSFHSEVWRRLREKVNDVNSTSLETATRLFPDVLKNTISNGDRILAEEKDHVIRHILCPALDGQNELILSFFTEMGNRRIADFRKSSQESTKDLLEGTLKSFSNSSGDRVWIENVVTSIEGKRRARSFLDILWGLNKDED